MYSHSTLDRCRRTLARRTLTLLIGVGSALNGVELIHTHLSTIIPIGAIFGELILCRSLRHGVGDSSKRRGDASLYLGKSASSRYPSTATLLSIPRGRALYSRKSTMLYSGANADG